MTSETTFVQRRWGVTYNTPLPERYGCAWGARMILSSRGELDLLWDRQYIEGPSRGFGLQAPEQEDTKKRFAEALDAHYIPAVRSKVKALCRALEMETSSSGSFVLIDDGHVKVVASPNGSYGYLYIVAYTADNPDGKWSGVGPIPEIGDVVTVSDCGPCTVLGRDVLHGHVVIVGSLHEALKKTQGGTPLKCFFGADLG